MGFSEALLLFWFVVVQLLLRLEAVEYISGFILLRVLLLEFILLRALELEIFNFTALPLLKLN